MTNKMMGAFANKLLDYIDSTRVRDVNYNIALEMLKNYNRLNNMSITEVAEMCYVSTATISRFCKFMGCDSFTDFKDQINRRFKVKDDYSKKFYQMLPEDPETAMSIYRNELINNVDSILNNETYSVVQEIVERIHNHEHIAFFGTHFNLEIGKQFQKKMALMGKYIEMYCDWEGQTSCAEKLTKDSLAIVLTIEGGYWSRYASIWSEIRESKCEIVAITQNVNSVYCNQADYVVPCGVTNRDNMGRFGALTVIELLTLYYSLKYESEDDERKE